MEHTILERPTRMTFDELREEIDAVIMTRGVSRDVKVIAEAVSRLISIQRSRETRVEP